MKKNGINRRDLMKASLGLGVVSMLPALGSTIAQAQDRIFVPFANKSLDYYFFATEEEAVRRAVQKRKWEFQATNASFDNTKQLEQMQSLMLNQPSAIICDSIDSKAITSVISRYNQRNIPVAVIDTPADGGKVAVTVSFDNYQGGVMAAEEIVKRLEKRYGSAKGIVLNCYGALSSVAWRLRKEGFDSVMAKYPDITVLARPTDGLLENMLSVTLSTLSEYPQLDAVHAPSDSPSRGIATALQQRGRWKKVDEDGHVIFVNIDGEPVAIHWIKEGHMDACVSQDPIAYGEIAVELLEKYSLKGAAVPLGLYENNDYFWQHAEIINSSSGPALVIPPFIIDSSNVDDKRHWGTVAEQDWKLKYN